MRGLKIIEILRKKFSHNIPIAIVSAVRSTAVIAYALELGASEYLCKPLLRHQFDELIEKYLAKEESNFHLPSMSKIKKEVQKAEVSFHANVVEVFGNGFTMSSNFMISKGTQLKVSSQLVKDIFDTDHIYLYVAKNELIDEENNLFSIEAEIDRYDYAKNEKLREWLNKMKSRNIK
jgi:DNA-binding response OmpR family regulator